jgi:hypothetical protein
VIRVFLFWLVILAVATLVMLGGLEKRLREIYSELRQIRDILQTRADKERRDALGPDV